MNILIFLAVILVTIVLAIFFNRLVHCPLLVGTIFFSIALLVAVILSNLTLVILAIILGIIAFVTAFLDCIFKNNNFFTSNNCIQCNNPYDDNANVGCNNTRNESNTLLSETNTENLNTTPYVYNCRRYRKI